MISKRFLSLLLVVAFAASVFGGTATPPAQGPAADREAVAANATTATATAAAETAPDVGAPAASPSPEHGNTPGHSLPACEPATYTSHVTPTTYAPDRLRGCGDGGQANNTNREHDYPAGDGDRHTYIGAVLRL